MTATLHDDIQKLQLLQAAKVLHAYLECSNAIQAGIRDMLEIVNNPATDVDDRDMALFTLADALFPNPHEGKLGLDLQESEVLGASESAEMRAVLAEMDEEEDTFAQRLRDLMDRKEVTQTTLAERLGIRQSAISNMLNRQCRPQRRTVLRLAEALEVSPEDLWPSFSQERG